MKVLIAALALAASGPALALDHGHKAWGALLGKHVRYVQDGNASRADYAGFLRDREAIRALKADVAFLDHDWGLNDVAR